MLSRPRLPKTRSTRPSTTPDGYPAISPTGECDFRFPWPPGELVARHFDQPTAEPCEQRCVIRPGLTAHSLRLPLASARVQAEESQLDVAGRHRGVHLAHRCTVLRRSR